MPGVVCCAHPWDPDDPVVSRGNPCIGPGDCPNGTTMQPMPLPCIMKNGERFRFYFYSLAAQRTMGANR